VSSFKRGFSDANPLVLLAAVALLLPALLGIQWFFTSGAWSAAPMQCWIRNSTDQYVAVSWQVGRLKRDPPTLPMVTLLAGSGGLEGIVSGRSLAAAVRRDGGPRIVAYNLSSQKQRFAQSWAIVDNLPNTPTTVLIGVNLGRFTTSPGSNYDQVIGRDLLLKSDSLRRYVIRTSGQERYSYTILPGIFSALTSYAQQHEHDLLYRGRWRVPPYRVHPMARRKALSFAAKQALVKTWLTQYQPAFNKRLDFSLAMLEGLVRRARERGLGVVIVELPLNREVIGDRFEQSIAKYTRPTRAIAERYDVPYLDFNARVAIPSSDFVDLSHLMQAGREVWEAELARELARLYDEGALPVEKP
jgi:hypothetical protein